MESSGNYKQFTFTMNEFDAARLEKFCERYSCTKSQALRFAIIDLIIFDEIQCGGDYEGLDYSKENHRGQETWSLFRQCRKP